jgi:16S rRNA (cytosine967-C5)-methyltransferase
MENDLIVASRIVQQIVDGKNIDKIFMENISNKNNVSLVKDIVYGSIRNYYLYEAQLYQLLKSEIKSKDIKFLLINAIYQLNHQAIKKFTIVNQNVEASKKINQKLSNFVNAILRNYLRKQNEINEVNERDLNYSYPQWWVDKLKKQYKDYEEILRVGNTRGNLVIRINKRKTTEGEYLDLLEKHNIEYVKIISNKYIQIQNEKDIKKLPKFMDGFFYVQDPGAQLAVNFLDLKDEMSVLDLCASPGGKATHMLEEYNINLDCYDISAERLNLIKDNLERLGHHAKILKNLELKSQYDRVLVDAPCSGSGVVRRHVDIKMMRKEEDIKKFQNQQLDLLKKGWKLLKKNGKLLYITCSIFEEENMQVVENFLKTENDIQIGDIKIPESFMFINSQLIPNREHDGLYFKLFIKN